MKFLFLIACSWRLTGVTDAFLSNARHPTPTRRHNAQNVRFEFQTQTTSTQDDGEAVTRGPCRCPDDEDSKSSEHEWEDAKEAFFATLGGLWAATTVPFQ